MKQTKKRFSILLVAAVLLSMLTAGAWAQEDFATRGEVVELLLIAADDYNPKVQKTDIIKGYEDGQLHEDRFVTRAEALVMLERAFGSLPELKGNNLRLALPQENFNDVPAWAASELSPVFKAGLVAGTAEGCFSPDDNVTKGQMELFISRVFITFGTNPKDSFYASINKKELDTMEIQDGEAMAGTLAKIQSQTTEQVAAIIKESVNSTPVSGSAQEKIKILYNNIIDMEARNAAGYSPICADLKAIEGITRLSELDDIMLLDGTGSALSMLADFTLTIDAMDSGSYITLLLPASASLAKQVYEGQDALQKRAYLNYVTTVLALCGETQAEAEKSAQAYFDFEKQLSDASLSIAEQYDLEKTYNLYSFEDLKAAFGTVDLEALFAQSQMKDKSKLLVMDKGNMTQLASMLRDDNIESLKNYLKIKLILGCVGLFGEDFRQAAITYSQEAHGLTGSKPLEETAAEIVSGTLHHYVGEAYAEKYCTDEIIADVTKMTHDIIAVYRDRILALDWMSQATKQKALLKLDTMQLQVGAPDYSKESSPLDNASLKSAKDGGSYFQNMIEIGKAMQKENARLSGQPVDKTEWITTPQTVNAFYMPSFNGIYLPMAFMQAPIYDKNASYEENLGSLGFVIGHELTHAFDSSGSQYDENGNAANWWTKEDFVAFGSLCADVISYFDGVEAAPGIATDGTLTLTENIADLGALSCVVKVGQKHEGFRFKKMFESYAKLWASTTTRDFSRHLSYNDVHSANAVRVDRVLQSSEMFYEVYGIGEKDGMFVPVAERARIW